MKNHKNNFLTLFLISLLLLFARDYKSITNTTKTVISFKNDVQLVLVGNCQTSGSHGATDFANFPLVTYDSAINNGEVRVGKPDNSEIYKSIAG